MLPMILLWGGIPGALLLGGYGVYEWLVSKMDEAKVEGEKEGYEKASREYEVKLREQYEMFMKQINILHEAIERLRLERDKARTFAWRALRLVSWLSGQNPAGKLDLQEQELFKQEQELGKEAFALLGNFEGCITKLEEQGLVVEDKTMDYYEQLQKFTADISKEVKIFTQTRK